MKKSVTVKIWDDPKNGLMMSEEDQSKVFNMMCNENEIMKEITKIRLENLKEAEYIVIMLNASHGHVWNELYRHSFTEMLDIMMTTNNIDEAVEGIDVPVGGWWTVTDEFQVDFEKEVQEEPMIIMRVK